MIYLDHNATTPIDRRVLVGMMEVAEQADFNPSSLHGPGRIARRMLSDFRDSILQRLCHDPSAYELIFTSGGTESNNLALRGLIGQPPGRLIVSAIEHPSISATAQTLAEDGYDVQTLPVNRLGVVQLDRLGELLSVDTRLVSVMVANHETGVVQPMEEIAAMCREHRAWLHTDAVQWAGKGPIDCHAWGLDALTFAPHKFHGPRGIGGLLIRKELPLRGIMSGGPQQGGLRPGTESLMLVAGAAMSLTLAVGEIDERRSHLTNLRDRLQRLLVQRFADRIEILSAEATRAPQTLCVSFPGLDRQMMVLALDQAGVACATGSACASGSSQPSPVLLAMGLSREVVGGALRFSVGVTTTEAEIDRAAEIVDCVLRKLL